MQVWADSKPLTVPLQTPYKSFKSGRYWQEWLSLPILYSQIPLSAQLAITVWDQSPVPGEDGAQFHHAIPYGGTTIPLFDKDNTLQKGRQRCRLHRHKRADGFSNATTPWIIPPVRGRKLSKLENGSLDERQTEMRRLETLVKKHEMGEIPEVKWLDQMVFRQIEKLERSIVNDAPTQHAAHDSREGNSTSQENGDYDDTSGDEQFYLYIEFPRFDHPIIFTDTEYPAPPISTLQTAGMSSSEVRLKPPPEVSFGPGINIDDDYQDDAPGRLIRIYDPEVGIRDNPAESKHRRLVRSHRGGVLDRDLKPNAKIRDELNVSCRRSSLVDTANLER